MCGMCSLAPRDLQEELKQSAASRPDLLLCDDSENNLGQEGLHLRKPSCLFLPMVEHKKPPTHL